MSMCVWVWGVCEIGGLLLFFFQAEDGIRDLVRSRGLGDVYKRQLDGSAVLFADQRGDPIGPATVPQK